MLRRINSGLYFQTNKVLLFGEVLILRSPICMTSTSDDVGKERRGSPGTPVTVFPAAFRETLSSAEGQYRENEEEFLPSGHQTAK